MLADNDYSGNISLTSSGADTQTIQCNGRVGITTAINKRNTNPIRVYNKNSNIVIEGTLYGECIKVYAIDGKIIRMVKSEGDKIEIPLSKKGMYLIKTIPNTFKVLK